MAGVPTFAPTPMIRVEFSFEEFHAWFREILPQLDPGQRARLLRELDRSAAGGTPDAEDEAAPGGAGGAPWLERLARLFEEAREEAADLGGPRLQALIRSSLKEVRDRTVESGDD